MMKKISFFVLMVTFMHASLLVKAQDYQTTIGLRCGVSSGFSLKFYKDEANAIEGLLSFRQHGMQLTVLKEYYRPIMLKHSDHIFAFYGWGGHLGFQWPSTDDYHWDYPPMIYSAGPTAGIDAIIGAEYRFYKVPFTLGMNFKPFAEVSFTRFFFLNLWDYGFSIKYSLK